MCSVIDRFLLDAFGVLSCQFFQYCSPVWCSAADTHLKLLDIAVSGAQFLAWVCLSVTFLIVDPWQSCVCIIRSGVTRFTLLMVLYLDCMCQHGLHAVLWSHIGTLMHRLAAEPCSTAGLLFPSQGRDSRAGPMLLYWPKLLYPYYSRLLFFLSIGWYCGAGVFGLIGCTSLSLSLALPTIFNNNNNYYYYYYHTMETYTSTRNLMKIQE